MIARTEGICQEITSDFGTKYITDGELATPVGTAVQVCTIWVIDAQDDRLRL